MESIGWMPECMSGTAFKEFHDCVSGSGLLFGEHLRGREKVFHVMCEHRSVLVSLWKRHLPLLACSSRWLLTRIPSYLFVSAVQSSLL